MEFLFIGIFGAVIGFCLGIGFTYTSEDCEHEWEFVEDYHTVIHGISGRPESDKYTEVYRCDKCKELKTSTIRF